MPLFSSYSSFCRHRRPSVSAKSEFKKRWGLNNWLLKYLQGSSNSKSSGGNFRGFFGVVHLTLVFLKYSDKCPVTDHNDRLYCISACISWEIFINIWDLLILDEISQNFRIWEFFHKNPIGFKGHCNKYAWIQTTKYPLVAELLAETDYKLIAEFLRNFENFWENEIIKCPSDIGFCSHRRWNGCIQMSRCILCTIWYGWHQWWCWS